LTLKSGRQPLLARAGHDPGWSSISNSLDDCASACPPMKTAIAVATTIQTTREEKPAFLD
jgi:hypothetical protein